MSVEVDRAAEALHGIGSPFEGCRSPSYILVITVISVAVGHRRQPEEVSRQGGRSRTQETRTFRVVVAMRPVRCGRRLQLDGGTGGAARGVQQL